MKSYCLKWGKDTENINSRVSNTTYGKTMSLWKCAVSESKKSIFIKKQEAQAILSNFGLKTPLSKVPLLGDVLLYKINETVNKFLLAGYKFMLEMQLNNLDLLTVLVDQLLKTKQTKGVPNENLADSESFKSKVKITESTPDDGNEKVVEIVLPLKYLSNYWSAIS